MQIGQRRVSEADVSTLSLLSERIVVERSNHLLKVSQFSPISNSEIRNSINTTVYTPENLVLRAIRGDQRATLKQRQTPDDGRIWRSFFFIFYQVTVSFYNYTNTMSFLSSINTLILKNMYP